MAMTISNRQGHIMHAGEGAIPIRKILSFGIVVRAVSVAASLNIADLLAEEPRTASAVADAAGLHGHALYRLLRELSTHGIFAELDDGTFTNTPLSEYLRSGVPGSVRDLGALFATDWHWRAHGALEDAVRTGESGMRHLYGSDLFEFLATDPDAECVYNAAMAARPDMTSDQVVDAYDFRGVDTIVDVGSGVGELLIGILAANPESRGTLFDLPSVGPAAREAIHGAGLQNRCSFVEGDFFTQVPEFGDHYVLRHVLHQWDDEAALRILRNCRAACTDNSRLLLVEQIVQPGRSTPLDLLMMVLTAGGRERTAAEFAELLSQVGFELQRIRPTSGTLSIIEASPAR
jgi:hypothetical protein